MHKYRRPCNSAMKSRVFSRNGSAKTCLMLRLAPFRCSAVTMRATASRRGAEGGRRKSGSLAATCSQVQGHTRRGRGQPIAHRWRCAIRSLKILRARGCGAVRGNVVRERIFGATHTTRRCTRVLNVATRSTFART